MNLVTAIRNLNFASIICIVSLNIMNIKSSIFSISELFKFTLFGSMILSVCGSVDFLMTGDWGGMSAEPYYTPAQLAAAKAMSANFNPRFVLGLGDNFYSTGIETDETSSRFTKTWAEVYNPTVPWYLALETMIIRVMLVLRYLYC